MEYVAVTKESGACGEVFRHRGVTKGAAIALLGFFKWMNVLAAFVIGFGMTDKKDSDVLEMGSRVNKEKDALIELIEEPKGVSEFTLTKWR